uniref:Uncharacterized protein n=1 Tax=Wuchereria bancrofti TaxID=6293 RepID=A0AAF5Q630_WUCBA
MIIKLIENIIHSGGVGNADSGGVGNADSGGVGNADSGASSIPNKSILMQMRREKNERKGMKEEKRRRTKEEKKRKGMKEGEEIFKKLLLS